MTDASGTDAFGADAYNPPLVAGSASAGRLMTQMATPTSVAPPPITMSQVKGSSRKRMPDNTPNIGIDSVKGIT
jgi:hypothetical protein